MASPFSFHCIVCVEEFHADERYPVVLPCGHTYVCNECANRLDKCMECRTSLSLMISPSTASSTSSLSSPMVRHLNSPTTTTTTGWSSARTGGRIHSNIHSSNNNSNNNNLNTRTLPQRVIPPPPVTRRLPLPKNVVLLSLMEATAMTIQDLPDSPMESPIRQSITLEDTEEQSIRDGTSLATGMCGTYIINKTSVPIFPSRPTNADTYAKSRSDVPEEEDVDSLVRFFHMDHQDMKSDTRLNRGDRVQIVSLEDGWAKLARGYGFLRADAGQLVKGMLMLLLVFVFPFVDPMSPYSPFLHTCLVIFLSSWSFRRSGLSIGSSVAITCRTKKKVKKGSARFGSPSNHTDAGFAQLIDAG